MTPASQPFHRGTYFSPPRAGCVPTLRLTGGALVSSGDAVGISPEMPVGISPEMPVGISQEMPVGISQEMPVGISPEMPVGISVHHFGAL